ncbi:endolytic transglycosylase MltG, partial [Aeromonas veronii]|nr:endolytic transglycosylase MltG [Aeromonas veronii]
DFRYMSDNESKKDLYKKNLQDRHREAKTIRKFVFIVFIVILVVLSGIIGGGYLYIKSALEPVDPTNKEPIEVTIPIGSSPTAIARILEENDIVKHAKVFRYYTKFKNVSGFQAGEYTFNQSMNFDQIIESLKSGILMGEPAFKLVIPEGKQLEEIAIIIAEQTGYTKEEIMEKVDDPTYIKDLISRFPNTLSEEILNKDIKHP